MILPKQISGWVRSDTLKTVTEKSIFDYMNGAGELYLGYRFDRLEVSYYQQTGQDDIMVELYFMKSEDDAFGLLSQDWNGDPVPFVEDVPGTAGRVVKHVPVGVDHERQPGGRDFHRRGRPVDQHQAHRTV